MRNLLILTLIVSLASCTHVLFDVPQPANGAILLAFPEKFHGLYQVDGEPMDSLLVGHTTVTFIEHSKHEISMQSLDTMLHITLKDGLLYNAELMRPKGVPYQIMDTLIKYEYYDRLTMGISDTLIIKYNKKYLVVNSNFSDDGLDYWDVVLVEKLKSGDLRVMSIGNLQPPDEDNPSGSYKGKLTEFGSIAPYEKLSDNTYLFKPTSKQFAKLVRKNLFSEKKFYKKYE